MGKALLALLCVGAVIAIGVSLSSSSDSKSSTSNTTTTGSYSSNSYSSNSYSSKSYSSGGSSSGGGNSGNRSSYWYDSPEVRKKKADDTLMKYYEYDENGNLTKKEGTIVNGKPYHKTK